MDTIPVLDERYFLDRLQSPEDCFYFPEPEPNTPVIFRGQCNDSIAAISNFNDTQVIQILIKNINLFFNINRTNENNNAGQ